MNIRRKYIIWWKSLIFAHSRKTLRSPNSIVERGVTEYQNPRFEREFCQAGSMNILIHIGWRVVHSFSALTPKGNKIIRRRWITARYTQPWMATRASEDTETMSTMLMWKIRFIEINKMRHSYMSEMTMSQRFGMPLTRPTVKHVSVIILVQAWGSPV